MAYLRKNHLAIAGTLFVIAALLFFSGLAPCSAECFFLGAAVEVAAWVSPIQAPHQALSTEGGRGDDRLQKRCF